MSKARLLAFLALGLMAFDVLVNFSLAAMNTAMDVGIFAIVALMLIAMKAEK